LLATCSIWFFQKQNSLWKIPFIATAIYGIGLILFAPATVLVNGVIWHLLRIAAIIVLAFAAVRRQRFASEQRDAPESRGGAV
jgi:hypothetical protein